MPAPGWPADLTTLGGVQLLALTRARGLALAELHERNRDWLARWEATPVGAPPVPRGPRGVRAYREYAARCRRAARHGRALPWVIAVDGLTVGHVLISAITRGAADSGAIGYWIAERFAGRGIAPAAVAAAFDHAVGPAGLHRVEALIHEDNAPSLAVMAKLGFRDEGVRRGCLHVGREWVDHRVFALTREDVPEGLVVRWGGGGWGVGGEVGEVGVDGMDWVRMGGST